MPLGGPLPEWVPWVLAVNFVVGIALFVANQRGTWYSGKQHREHVDYIEARRVEERNGRLAAEAAAVRVVETMGDVLDTMQDIQREVIRLAAVAGARDTPARPDAGRPDA